MDPKVETWLRKIENPLKLESKGGFKDLAVIGGLSLYFQRWLDQGHGSGMAPGVLRSLETFRPSFTDYAALSPKDREARIAAFLMQAALLKQDGARALPPVGKS